MRWWIVILVVVTSTACVDLGFKTPQPAGASNIYSFPEELQGTFVHKEDTIIVTPSTLISGNDSTKIAFSDSVILREHNGWYFLNLTEVDKDYWTVVCAKRSGNKLVVKIPEIKKEDKSRIEKHWQVTEKYSQLNNLDAYVIDPAVADWKRLLRSRFFNATRMKIVD